jgi:SSS family solute:Na+ symporter
MSCNLWQAAWAWVVCFVVTAGLSLVTKPKPEEELEGLVKGLTPKASRQDVPPLKRPSVWAAAAGAVAVVLNIYFW